MKILHWSFILIIIILPISIVCRNLVNTKFVALKDEVRINNAIDTATKDAIDQIISTNSGFLASGFEYDSTFNDAIDITPSLAQESINTFFHSLAINYNLPYKMSDTSLSDSSSSYIKNYFSSYVPAIVIVAYDGFYVYSIEQNASGVYSYQLSSKIPYTFSFKDSGGRDVTIGYTLKNDVYLCLHPNSSDQPVCYSGKLGSYKYSELKSKYEELGITDPDTISLITNDMSVIVYCLLENRKITAEVARYLIPEKNTSEVFSMVDDKDSFFHVNRRKTITKIISQCLREEMNEQNYYADKIGVTYNFTLPEINEDDWYNAINDITVLAFIQGIPIGTARETYFNSYALGGSQIVRAEYLYGKNYNGTPLYHKKSCSLIADESYESIFIDREDAASKGYYSCQLCNP